MHPVALCERRGVNWLRGTLLTLLLLALCGPASAGEPSAVEARERCALLDEIWSQLAAHDAFFDPRKPEFRKLRAECRARLAALEDPSERLREVVRLVSRLGDGHAHLTTRWFLPDKPPPPLPLAGAAELYKPVLAYQKFHRDYFVRCAPPQPTGDNAPAPGDGAASQPALEFCRIRSIDGALLTHGSGWALLNGARDTLVPLELERPNGEVFELRLPRTVPVKPPRTYGPTSRVTTTRPDGGVDTTEVEVVVKSRRLDGNVGYIQIEHLVTQQVVTDFHAALDALMDTDGLILDLRGTGGGYPWIMLPIAGRFFDTPQKVCTFEGRSPLIATLVRGLTGVVAPVGRTYAQPLVVLIDDGTGSMSEGLSFALGDTGRAVLMGRATRGLNAAIRNTTLANGLVLWHSWIRVNRLNGQHYQGVGVQPHELVEIPTGEALQMGVDQAVRRERALQLERAQSRLAELIAARSPRMNPGQNP